MEGLPPGYRPNVGVCLINDDNMVREKENNNSIFLIMEKYAFLILFSCWCFSSSGLFENEVVCILFCCFHRSFVSSKCYLFVLCRSFVYSSVDSYEVERILIFIVFRVIGTQSFLFFVN